MCSRNLQYSFPGFFYPEYKENRFLQKHQEVGTWSHNLEDTNLWIQSFRFNSQLAEQVFCFPELSLSISIHRGAGATLHFVDGTLTIPNIQQDSHLSEIIDGNGMQKNMP